MSEEVVWSTCENNSTSVHHRNLSYIYLSVPPLAATEHSALEMIDEVLNENRKFFNSPFTIPLASQEEDDGAHHHDDDEDVQNPLTVGAMRARRQHSGSLNANRHHDGDRGDEGRNRRDSAYSVDEQNFRDFDYDQRDIRRQAQSNAPPGSIIFTYCYS